MRVIDLTHTIKEDMPVYPGTETPTLTPVSVYEKDGFRESLLRMTTHTGTHMDPPAHLFPGRTTLDEFPASQFIGKALVIDCSSLKEGEEITLAHITRYGEKAEKADFLLFYLGWDKRWGSENYFGDYPCLNEEALDFVIRGAYKGIGFDVIGLDPIADAGLPRHKKLFREKNIVNIVTVRRCERSLGLRRKLDRNVCFGYTEIRTYIRRNGLCDCRNSLAMRGSAIISKSCRDSRS